ncbi:Crp/Fnr family transcriptional regulator [Thioalkalivibrio sp. XN8]|uniref:Crp/Fnr family transcriptional regulator n=1 Tax=Thioalkalivibrio sp. XN8 TaxID=2712863 RepID=UPI0013EA9A35|nr:Crp/Fnr family transcriptional regulator [Thioalkalivibrio sp. XN8]NGP53396.1 Crp/Fnr family transcriptional regulator [Thioalkalivibrio sp. XN8]
MGQFPPNRQRPWISPHDQNPCAECFSRLSAPRLVRRHPSRLQAGDAGREFFGVRSGVVTMQGRFTHPDAVMLHMLRAGDWFGTAPVLAGRSRRATAVARTDVELLLVPGGELQALLRRHPEWIVDLARDVVYFLDVALQGSADLLIRDAAARCAAVLLRLAGRRWASGPDAHLPADIPASQSELAMLCNVSRNTFSRVVQELASRPCSCRFRTIRCSKWGIYCDSLPPVGRRRARRPQTLKEKLCESHWHWRRC